MQRLLKKETHGKWGRGGLRSMAFFDMFRETLKLSQLAGAPSHVTGWKNRFEYWCV